MQADTVTITTTDPIAGLRADLVARHTGEVRSYDYWAAEVNRFLSLGMSTKDSSFRHAVRKAQEATAKAERLFVQISALDDLIEAAAEIAS